MSPFTVFMGIIVNCDRIPENKLSQNKVYFAFKLERSNELNKDCAQAGITCVSEVPKASLRLNNSLGLTNSCARGKDLLQWEDTSHS